MSKWKHFLRYFEGNSLVTGEFPAQSPVTRSFDAYFDLCLNKRLSKPLWGWWLETPSRSLWCHRNDMGQLPQLFDNIQYILWIIHSFGFVEFWYRSFLLMSFRAASLARGPSANEATLIDVGKWITLTHLRTDATAKQKLHIFYD